MKCGEMYAIVKLRGEVKTGRISGYIRMLRLDRVITVW